MLSAVLISAIYLLIRFIYRFYEKHYSLDKIEKKLKTGEFQNALDLSLKYLKNNSPDFLIYYYIAQAYEGLFQYRHAIENYEKVLVELEKENKNSLKNEIRFKLGDLYNKIQDFNTSLGYYNIILKENPKNLNALYNSAEVLFKLKSYILAKKNLEIYTSIKPDVVKASFLLAKVYFILGEFQKSIHELNKVLKDEDAISVMFVFESSFLLARNYMALKRYKETVQILKPFLEKTQFLDKILDIIILALIKDKKTDEAMQIADDYFLKVSVQRRCELLYQIAQVYFDEGEIFKAVDLWKQAVEINPKYKDLQDIIARYHILISNQYLRSYFTTDDGEFEETMLKKLGLNNGSILERGKLFWIFKDKDVFHAAYKHYSIVTLGILEEIEKIVINHKGPNYSIILYCIFGVDNLSRDYYLYKKIKEVSNGEFLEFFKIE